MNSKSEDSPRNFMYLIKIGEKISEKVRDGWIKSLKICNKTKKITLKVGMMN